MKNLNITGTRRITSRLKPIHGAPDLLPFVDIFFLLLFFFMLNSSFIPISGIPVTLPEVAETRVYSAKKHVVTVDSQNRIYFNDVLVKDLVDLKNKLYQIVANRTSQRAAIVLRADKSNSFAQIAGIMALAEELQLNVFILAKKVETPQVNFYKEDKL